MTDNSQESININFLELLEYLTDYKKISSNASLDNYLKNYKYPIIIKDFKQHKRDNDFSILLANYYLLNNQLENIRKILFKNPRLIYDIDYKTYWPKVFSAEGIFKIYKDDNFNFNSNSDNNSNKQTILINQSLKISSSSLKYIFLIAKLKDYYISSNFLPPRELIAQLNLAGIYQYLHQNQNSNNFSQINQFYKEMPYLIIDYPYFKNYFPFARMLYYYYEKFEIETIRMSQTFQYYKSLTMSYQILIKNNLMLSHFLEKIKFSMITEILKEDDLTYPHNLSFLVAGKYYRQKIIEEICERQEKKENIDKKYFLEIKMANQNHENFKVLNVPFPVNIKEIVDLDKFELEELKNSFLINKPYNFLIYLVDQNHLEEYEENLEKLNEMRKYLPILLIGKNLALLEAEKIKNFQYFQLDLDWKPQNYFEIYEYIKKYENLIEVLLKLYHDFYENYYVYHFLNEKEENEKRKSYFSRIMEGLKIW